MHNVSSHFSVFCYKYGQIQQIAKIPFLAQRINPYVRCQQQQQTWAAGKPRTAWGYWHIHEAAATEQKVYLNRLSFCHIGALRRMLGFFFFSFLKWFIIKKLAPRPCWISSAVQLYPFQDDQDPNNFRPKLEAQPPPPAAAWLLAQEHIHRHVTVHSGSPLSFLDRNANHHEVFC